MDEQQLTDLMRRQAGVVSRRQLLDHGGTDRGSAADVERTVDNHIERMLRLRRWTRIHRGVYVDHPGPLSWQQRAWAAVLFYAPAALGGASALRAAGARSGVGAPDGPIVVVVDRLRRIDQIPGTRVRRIRGYEAAVMGNTSPPRLRLEQALLDEASIAKDDEAALAILADACQARLTAPRRLVSALEGRTRLRRRRWLMEVLTDVASGALSVLEHRFLVRVERAHALPPGCRQLTDRRQDGTAYRDVSYVEFTMLVELDGRLRHEAADDRWSDLDRDVDAAVAGSITVRLGWRQVLRPCRTAAALARILQSRGWAGRPVPCSPECSVSSATA